MFARFGWLIGCLLWNSASASTNEVAEPPTERIINETANSFRHCQLSSPELLSADFHRFLKGWLLTARVDSEDDDLYAQQRLIQRHLRLRTQPDELSVFELLCRTGSFQIELRHLNPGDPFVHGAVAFVPLIGPDGDYAGSGFFLVHEEGGWRVPPEYQVSLARWSGVHPAYPELTRALLERNQSVDGHLNLELPECPLPPAPGPEWSAEEEASWEAAEDFDNPVANDNDNLRGYLQRRALEHYGSGRERPPTRSARALYVELLYRRAWFENGPGLGSKLWAERILEADRALRDAVALGADLTRLAPVVREIAGLHLRGAGSLMIDPGTAHELYRLAAEAGDDEAVVQHAHFTAYGLDGAAANCDRAIELLRPLAASDHDDALLESARIHLQCPDPSKRAPQRAMDLLTARLAKEGYVNRQLYAPLLASAKCALATQQVTELATPPPACELPEGPLGVSAWLADLFEAKRQRMAGESEEEIEALPGPGSKPEWTDPDLIPLLADKSCELPR